MVDPDCLSRRQGTANPHQPLEHLPRERPRAPTPHHSACPLACKMMRRQLIRICGLFVAVLLSCSETENPIIPTDGNDTDTIPSEPPNNPPVVFEHPDTSTTVGSIIYLRPIAYDIDGDSLIYDCFVNSSWSDLKRGTVPNYQFFDELKVLVFAPQWYDRPSRRVYFIVDDGRGGADTTRFTVFVE
jgi:hypothetical protein